MNIKLSSHIKGDTFDGVKFKLEINERNGVVLNPPEPISLIGADIIATFRFAYPNNIIFKTFDLNNGILINNANTGEFTLLPNYLIDWNVGLYYFDIDVINSSGVKKTYFIGNIQIVQDSYLNNDNNYPNLFVPQRPSLFINENIPYGNECLGEDNICSAKILFCEEPWINKICSPYIVNQGNMSPDLEFIVMQKGDSFGDPLYMDLTDYIVTIKIYDDNNKLKVKGRCDFINQKLGFIKYKWDRFDTMDTGNYSANFILKNTETNSEIVITNKNNRIDIMIV